ncbi:MAG: flagellar basal body-associated FliL family protein [Bacteroidota bacterium]|nr:flagellar basal body-associated FliL family protein [Bacteroidota bacterium]MDP4195683.1 flagellar basal body-associated FliL family protein [Bacteroidota bacterium]
MRIKFVLIFVLCSTLLLLSSCSKDKSKEGAEQAKENEVPFFYSVADIVINPAGTNAQRVMLVSLALQLKSDEDVKKIGEREALVKDVIVTSLSSKSIENLTAMGYKDSLKVELKTKLNAKLHGLNIKDIYFTKYIIQ